MEYLVYIRGVNIAAICVKILMAVILGSILGIERWRKHRPAGLRTYVLVCLGSAMVMMTNLYIFEQFDTSDPVRMGAQVISGIGFLGAGTILVTNRSQVKGVTTAAGLWAAACSGLAIGSGFYEGAVLGGVVFYIVMVTMQRLNKTLYSKSELIGIYVEYGGDMAFSSFLTHARNQGFEIVDLQINQYNKVSNSLLYATLNARSDTKRSHAEMIKILSEASGAMHIEEIS